MMNDKNTDGKAGKNYRMIFANNVRAIRRVNDISQEMLALDASISRVYVSDIEKGKRAVSIDVMGDIADALGVELVDLLNDDLMMWKSLSN